MDYIKEHFLDFSISKYYKQNAEDEFKGLIGSISHFQHNVKNLPLIQFVANIRKTNFKVVFIEFSL